MKVVSEVAPKCMGISPINGVVWKGADAAFVNKKIDRMDSREESDHGGRNHDLTISRRRTYN